MAILIEAVETNSDADGGVVRATVDGAALSARFTANPDATRVMMEDTFFFLLSERGLDEVGDSTAYHIITHMLIKQAMEGGPVGVPRELGAAQDVGRRRWWRFWGGRR